MSFIRINSIEKNLDSLFSEVSKLGDDDINKAHLARYLCVRTSGYVETVFKSLIVNLCDGTSPLAVKNFVEKRSKNISNLDYFKIHKSLEEFNKAWATQFENEVSEKQKNSLNSVISNRNNIAHGNPDSITYREMANYYSDVKSVVSLLKKIIKK